MAGQHATCAHFVLTRMRGNTGSTSAVVTARLRGERREGIEGDAELSLTQNAFDPRQHNLGGAAVLKFEPIGAPRFEKFILARIDQQFALAFLRQRSLLNGAEEISERHPANEQPPVKLRHYVLLPANAF